MILHSLVYQIDAKDCLVNVSNNWDEWAFANGGVEVTRHSVINQSIFGFISGESCRQIYRLLIDHVRKKHQESVFQFRCDSPGLRRYMEMKIMPEDDGYVVFESHVLKEDPRPDVSVLDLTSPRSHQSVVMCSLCQKVKCSDHQWQEIELVLDTEGFSVKPYPQLIYSVCESCVSKLKLG